MFIFLLILMILVSVFIVLVVLIQNPKGSGLTSGFAGAASNIIGVQKTGDVLEKATWGSIAILLMLSFLSTFFLPKAGDATQTKTKTEQLMNSPAAPQGVTPPAGVQPQPSPGSTAQPAPGGQQPVTLPDQQAPQQ